MSFMHKDINFKLMLMVIILAISIAAIGIYYNQNYSALSEDYTSRLTKLEKVTSDLFLYKTQLNKTSADLRLKEEDESTLNQKYAELRTENEALQGDNSRLNSELVVVRSELLDKTNELVESQSELVNKKAEIAQLTAEKNALQIKVKNLKNDLEDACNADFSVCD